MSKPRLLDLFSGAGGSARGYQLAGFHVTGVDHKPQPRYIGDEFHQADALTFPLEGYDAIHASPPCQFFTQMRASWRTRGVNDGAIDLLTPTLARLRAIQTPWIVENVVGAQPAMGRTILLHGAMFGLRVDRARLFESNVLIMAPPHQSRTKEPVGVYDSRPRGTTHFRTRLNGNGKGRSEMRIARTLEEAQEAMGMDWADWHGTKEAIPPSYTFFIGTQLMQQIRERAA